MYSPFGRTHANTRLRGSPPGPHPGTADGRSDVASHALCPELRAPLGMHSGFDRAPTLRRRSRHKVPRCARAVTRSPPYARAQMRVEVGDKLICMCSAPRGSYVAWLSAGSSSNVAWTYTDQQRSTGGRVR